MLTVSPPAGGGRAATGEAIVNGGRGPVVALKLTDGGSGYADGERIGRSAEKEVSSAAARSTSHKHSSADRCAARSASQYSPSDRTFATFAAVCAFAFAAFSFSAASSNATIATWPFSLAQSSAVLPSMFLASVVAPASSSRRTRCTPMRV